MHQLAVLEPQAAHHEPKGGGIWPMAAQGRSHGGLRRFREVSWLSVKSCMVVVFKRKSQGKGV